MLVTFGSKIVCHIKQNRMLPIYVLLCLIWSNQLFIFFRGFCLHLSYVKEIAPYIYPALVLIFALLSLKYIISKSRLGDVFFVLLCLFLYLISGAIFQQNIDSLIEYAPRFLFVALPLFCIGVVINLNHIVKPFYYLSIITIVAMSFYYLFFVQKNGYSGTAEETEDNMAAAYAILPHLLLVIWQTLKKINIINFVISIGGCFVLFSFGTRAPLLFVVLFLVYYLLFETKKKYKFLICSAFLSVGIIVSLFFSQILLFLYRISSQLGMSVRIVEKIASEELSTSHGRNVINDLILSKISDGWFIGYGIRGISSFSTVPYTHNLFLDFWLDFGVIFGSILLLCIIVLFILGWKNTHSENERVCFVFLLIMGFFHLMFSHTYLTCGFFFCSIGYCIQLIRKNNSHFVRNISMK